MFYSYIFLRLFVTTPSAWWKYIIILCYCTLFPNPCLVPSFWQLEIGQGGHRYTRETDKLFKMGLVYLNG